MQERRTLENTSIPDWAILTDGSQTEPLDVLFSKNDGSELAVFKRGYWPNSGWTPIGIVIVPGLHNRYGDGSCGVMSLVSMDCNNPEDGTPVTSLSLTDYDNTMYWGYYKGDVGNSIFSGRLSVDDNGMDVIPQQTYDYSEECSTNSYGTVLWPYTFVNSVPTNLVNTTYSNTGGYVSAITGAAGCDFNGIRNTAALYVATIQSAQWTANTVANEYATGTEGNTPAAACAGRFKTVGTNSFYDVYNDITENNINYGTSVSSRSNTGFWYLPAGGELCYLPSKRHEINKTIDAINRKYGAIAILLSAYGSMYWSSAQYDGDNYNSAFLIIMSNGRFLTYGKYSLFGHEVRAFLRFKLCITNNN